jgi:hypothetical protein
MTLSLVHKERASDRPLRDYNPNDPPLCSGISGTTDDDDDDDED